MAEARGIGGRVDDAQRDIDEALELVEAGGARIWEAELHRVRGELLRRLLPDSPGGASRLEVERCFLEALAVARRQQAKALELRAATSLARLRLGQDDRGDARQILSDVYGWFSEGFDTPDLTEARGLLTELG